MNMNYSEELRTFGQIISIAEKVYDSFPSIELHNQYLWGYELFKQILIRCKSIYKILPHSQLESNDEFCDLASVASLTRNLIEAYQMFYYLNIDKVDYEEAMLRFLLIELHHLAESEEISEFLGRKDVAQKYREEKRILREEIKNNRYYNSNHQNSIYKFISENNDLFYRKLKNQKGRCLTRKEINKRNIGNILGDRPLTEVFSDVSESAKIDIESGVKKFEAWDTYFSNHTHASPLSVIDMICENGGEDKNKHFFSVCIRHCDFYLGMSIFDIVELFKPHYFDINTAFPCQMRYIKKAVKLVN
ncbi:MAG TPA: hypothetical protein VK203_01880 [Nostocaceae cyanobacterium]|nr:hypothetical protein [Nostocaceae cyanobacterium]